MTRILLAAVLLFSLAAPARAEVERLLPVERRAGAIVVRAESGLESLAERALAVAAPALDSIAEDLAGLPAPERVEIRLVRQTADLGRAAPPGARPPAWAVGVAYQRAGVVVVAQRRQHEVLDLDSTLRHELAHLALGAALGGRAPRWLDEGFAFLHSTGFEFDRALVLTGMAWSGNVYRLADLAHHFPAEKHAASRAYTQAYDFVAFLARRGRYPDPDDDGDRWTFRAFLAAIARGATPDDAAREVYRADLARLTEEWYEDMRGRYWLIPVGLFGVGLWVFAALLLVAAFVRRRARDREILARWAEEEAAREKP